MQSFQPRAETDEESTLVGEKNKTNVSYVWSDCHIQTGYLYMKIEMYIHESYLKYQSYNNYSCVSQMFDTSGLKQMKTSGKLML